MRFLSVCCFFVFLFLSSSSAEAFQVRLLQTNKTTPLHKLMEKRSYWVFFRPDCSSCRLLFKRLPCFKEMSQVRVVGFDGSEALLKKELRQFKNLSLLDPQINGPFYGEKKLLKVLGLKKNLSPQVFVYEREGAKSLLKKMILGAPECDEIAALSD